MRDQFVLVLPNDDDSKRVSETPHKSRREIIRCAVDAGHARGGKRLGIEDVTFKKTPDENALIWTWTRDLIVSNRVLGILNAHGLTGFTADPILARTGVSALSEPPMFRLDVTGWGGVASEKSGVTRTKYCVECKYSQYLASTTLEDMFDPRCWDRSDFFFVWPAPRFIIVHERVIELLGKEEIHGWREEALSSQRFDGPLTPGTITNWLPEEQVANLRDQAGERELDFLV
jgi:hypothetical protein